MTTIPETTTGPDAFSLIGLALEAIFEHDTHRECDTPEMARALGYLAQARAQLRWESAHRESAAHQNLLHDPEAHVRFTAVCCQARIYRCGLLQDGLPSLPLVSQGEASCQRCGAELVDA